MSTDYFINIPLSRDTLDVYFVRTSILRAINSSLSYLNGKLLDVGCGKMPYKKYIQEHSAVKEYVGLDIDTPIIYDTNIKPDVTWDGVTMPFEADSFDCIIGTEVLEHCFDPHVTLSEIFRVLKPGGKFFFTVPFLWPLHEVPFDAYRYTPFALDRYLRQAGFASIDMKALGGWNASLAQMLGLWVRRRPQSSSKRELLSRLLLPVVRYLYKADKPPQSFNESTMITGLYGIAVK